MRWINRWLIVITLTIVMAIIFGLFGTFLTDRSENLNYTFGYGLPWALITGILGPYFLLLKKETKYKVIGFILWFVLGVVLQISLIEI